MKVYTCERTTFLIKASFQKACWNLERHLPNKNLHELEAATLPSVALEYFNSSGPKPP